MVNVDSLFQLDLRVDIEVFSSHSLMMTEYRHLRDAYHVRAPRTMD